MKNIRADREFRDKVRRILKKAVRVRPAKRLSAIEDDPGDNKFLECALEGKADCLITSDRHLLKLGNFFGTRICKPTQFLKLSSVEIFTCLSGLRRVGSRRFPPQRSRRGRETQVGYRRG